MFSILYTSPLTVMNALKDKFQFYSQLATFNKLQAEVLSSPFLLTTRPTSSLHKICIILNFQRNLTVNAQRAICMVSWIFYAIHYFLSAFISVCSTEIKWQTSHLLNCNLLYDVYSLRNLFCLSETREWYEF